MEIYTNSYIPDGYEVDHINGDCTDDRIENLQIITKELNILKGRYDLGLFKIYIKLKCPVCGKVFDYENHDFVTKIKHIKYFACSRSCSGKLTVLSNATDVSGTPYRNSYEYVLGYFIDINEIRMIEKELERNNVKYIKRYR